MDRVRRIQNKCWPDTGSTLVPLLFIAVVELITRKICTKVILLKLLYAGDLAVVAGGEANVSRQGVRVRLKINKTQSNCPTLVMELPRMFYMQEQDMAARLKSS